MRIRMPTPISHNMGILMPRGMLMHDDSTISGLLIVAFTPMLATATTPNPIETFPLGAGITASFISASFGRKYKETSTYPQAILSVVVGVSASLFLGPVVTDHVVGAMFHNPDYTLRTLVYFLLGLFGSSLIFGLWKNQGAIVNNVVKRSVLAKWLGDSKVIDIKITPVVPEPTRAPELTIAAPKQSNKPTTMASGDETVDYKKITPDVIEANTDRD